MGKWRGVLLFLSERSGTFNVFKQNIKTSDVEQITDFGPHPVRFLSAGGNVLVFGYHGQIYVMTNDEQAKPINISIRTQAVSSPHERFDINGGVSEMDVSPNGKEMAFIARGKCL